MSLAEVVEELDQRLDAMRGESPTAAAAEPEVKPRFPRYTSSEPKLVGTCDPTRPRRPPHKFFNRVGVNGSYLVEPVPEPCCCAGLLRWFRRVRTIFRRHFSNRVDVCYCIKYV
jgi:hypothetical protein